MSGDFVIFDFFVEYQNKVDSSGLVEFDAAYGVLGRRTLVVDAFVAEGRLVGVA